LNSTGPYVLFSSAAGIWITNPDGSYPTKISDQNLDRQDLRRAISPNGDRLALVVRNDQGLDLIEVGIPAGETKLIAHLLSVTPEELMNDPLNTKAFASYAISDFYDNVAWQPGAGQMLAFVGAINAPTSDLYAYDTQTENITQLTNGPSHAIDPNWSPDGKYILHYGVSWVPPFGGAIGGANQLDGAWAVQVSDGKVISLPKPKSITDNFVGWQDDSHYITYDSDDECFSQNLRSVDVVNGEITEIMDLSFYYQIVQSPENKALLFAGADGCATSAGEGIFLLPADQTTPTRLDDKKAYEVNWLSESGVFQAYPEALFSSDGSIRYDPPVYESSYHPAISKNGYQAWEVIENRQGRVMLKIPGGEWQTILPVLNGFVDKLIWDPISGDTLLIALDEGSLYSVSFPDFTPRLIGNLGGGTSQAIWTP
ncbi:MAG TPA: hypothetical protein VFI68_13660, partial [Anaerolineales bacterium]|nr:hypothetical protein [Anaerolineales bacterium]